MISIIILIEVKYYHQKLVTTVDQLVWTQYGSNQAICLSLPLNPVAKLLIFQLCCHSMPLREGVGVDNRQK